MTRTFGTPFSLRRQWKHHKELGIYVFSLMWYYANFTDSRRTNVSKKRKELVFRTIIFLFKTLYYYYYLKLLKFLLRILHQVSEKKELPCTDWVFCLNMRLEPQECHILYTNSHPRQATVSLWGDPRITLTHIRYIVVHFKNISIQWSSPQSFYYMKYFHISQLRFPWRLEEHFLPGVGAWEA